MDDLISYSPEPEASSDPMEIKLRESFLQRENCFSTSELLPQCCECEKDPMTNKYSCRFYDFRKIDRENGKWQVAGFLDHHLDPSLDDLNLWFEPEPSLAVDQEAADHILSFVATQFCEMSEEELKVGMNQSQVAWKRSVLQVREICDICDTSVFNFHWTCTHCGTCVCLDCHKERSKGIVRWKPKTKADKEERDNFFWLKCHGREEHDMMLTQMTTADSLVTMNKTLHEVCEARNITQTCGYSLRTKNCLKMKSKNILLEQQRPMTQLALRQTMKLQRYQIKVATTRRRSLLEKDQLS